MVSLRMSDVLMKARTVVRLALFGCIALALASCSATPLHPSMKPVPKDAMMLLGKKGMNTAQPIFIRIFKQESELEVWKQRLDGHFYHFKTFPICNWSGELGPKIAQGDKQAPEGFYLVNRHQMNANSGFHLAFNLGYPNAYDKAHNRTGDFLMVHGKCRSAGCYAMTDALIEEIYALAREAFIGGQQAIHVHAFPFRMTDANMARYRKHKWYVFWKTLKEGYDFFEATRKTPDVAVCERRYLVNVKFLSGEAATPTARCPLFMRPKVEAFKPDPAGVLADAVRVVVPGPKQRTFAAREADAASRMSLGAGSPVR